MKINQLNYLFGAASGAFSVTFIQSLYGTTRQEEIALAVISIIVCIMLGIKIKKRNKQWD